MTERKQVYIETFGCQMNERDSEIMAELCGRAAYHLTTDIEAADLVIVNTCSIRKKAEEKAFSLLGRLRRLKKDRPSILVAVTGCVAQQEGKRLLARMPHVNLVVGTQAMWQLPQLLKSCEEQKRACVATRLAPDFAIPFLIPTPVAHEAPLKSFVNIMQGCNNFCSYCIVPFTRGRETSRPLRDIIEEVTILAQKGVKEVTLLGQNVDSYGRGQNGQQADFPELLRRVAEIEGIVRIRFTTSHPKDLSDELMDCFRSMDKLCPHLHLPVQSGSNRVLKRMNRNYTREHYLDLVERLWTICPEIAITTDIIVGFPGEEEKDFGQTLDLLFSVRFHGAFSFKYSDRPLTRAANLDKKITEEEKNRRLSRLLMIQEHITLERNRELVGKTVLVMTEGMSKTAGAQWTGRTGTNHIVNFTGPGFLPGELIDVTIDEACLHSLRGRAVAPENGKGVAYAYPDEGDWHPDSSGNENARGLVAGD